MSRAATRPDKSEPIMAGQDVIEADLLQTLNLQKRAFAAEPYPESGVRIARLKRLSAALKDYRDPIIKALADDFGCRSAEETRLIEVGGTIANLEYAARHLRKWMTPRRRSTSIWFLPGSNKVVPQPLGVAGVMAPWNYPINLAVAPAGAAIAAGNRVMIKMSEHTPASAEVLSKIVRESFDPSELAVFSGDAEQAAEFSALPLNHLLFTGSTAIGRKVMMAATKHLTPVTLELGGKSPVIISSSYPVSEAAHRIIWSKCFNAGQTCVAPDYVLLPRGSAQEFKIWASRHYRDLFPQGALSSDYTSVIDGQNFDRLNAAVRKAVNEGADAVPLEPLLPTHREQRKFPLTLVFNPPRQSAVMQEELFGPVLPVLEVDDMTAAVAHINQGPAPLAVYLFSHSERDKDHLIERSHAGGVTINDVMLQYLQVSIPFGGVGGSGFGSYHGREGFDTFSHCKSVFTQRGVGAFTGVKLLYPPYGRIARKLIGMMGG